MHISEKDGTVTIDGFSFDGHIEEDMHCKRCEAYDAFFCPSCNDWTEKKCTDSRCYYCPDRPDKPLT